MQIDFQGLGAGTHYIASRSKCKEGMKVVLNIEKAPDVFTVRFSGFLHI